MDSVTRSAAIGSQRQDANRTERLWVADEWREFPVWRVPIDLLVLNVDNRRFAAERRYYESKLGRSLDPENVEADAESLESILLDAQPSRTVTDDHRVEGKPSKDTTALEADWQNRKQERPFWIRPDGVVHNGNRRLAMVRRRRRSYGGDGNTWVEVVVIEDDIDEITLFRMEQHEQLTEDYKVLYTDINLLLAIRDAAETTAIDWGDDEDIDRVAGELQSIIGNNKNYAIKQLHAIRYMDAFLEDSEQPGAYELLIGQIERFRDVGAALRYVRRLAPEREEDMLDVCFAAVRIGLRHGDIRAIRNMFTDDRDRFDKLVMQIREDENGWDPTLSDSVIREPVLAEAEGSSDSRLIEDDEDDTDDEPAGPNMPDYAPAGTVRRTFNTHLDGFKASRGVDALTLLSQAINRLEALVNGTTNLLEDAIEAEVDEAAEQLQKIVDWVDEHRRLLS